MTKRNRCFGVGDRSELWFDIGFLAWQALMTHDEWSPAREGDDDVACVARVATTD